MKFNIKSLYEYLTHIRFFGAPDYLKNRKINIHNCTSNLHYWEEELSRGVYCSICGNTVSQETYDKATN